jgi:hypothetical protein
MNSQYLKCSLCIDMKAIGFDELCVKYKNELGEIFNESHPDYIEFVSNNRAIPYTLNSGLKSMEYTIPKVVDVLRWLRNSKQVYIYSYPINLGNSATTKYRVTIITLTCIDNVVVSYDSYDKAIDKGIEEAYIYLK